MNGKWYIVVTIWSTWIFAFTFHDDLIPMTFDGQTLDKPFLGGFNRPKIQWIDWDEDGDIEILGSQESHLPGEKYRLKDVAVPFVRESDDQIELNRMADLYGATDAFNDTGKFDLLLDHLEAFR